MLEKPGSDFLDKVKELMAERPDDCDLFKALTSEEVAKAFARSKAISPKDALDAVEAAVGSVHYPVCNLR